VTRGLLLVLAALLIVACGAKTPPATPTAPRAGGLAMAPTTQPALVAGMSAFEIAIKTAAGATVTTLTAPSSAVTCVTGRSPASSTTSFLATDPVKVVWEPNTTQVCTWIGPTAGTLGLAEGGSYTATVVAISDAGVRGGASAPSNPFELSPTPATPANVRVIR